MVGACSKLSIKWMLLLWLFFFIAVFSKCAVANQQVAVLNENTDVINLGAYADYYIDESAELSYAQVSMPGFINNFKPISDNSLNLGYGDRAVWVKFSILWKPEDIREINERQWIVEQTSPFIDLVELYDVSPNGELRVLTTGDKLPFGEREFDFPHHLFSTSVLPYIEKTLYMRFYSNGPMRFQLKIRSLKDTIGSLAHHQVVMGLILGLMLVMAIYNFSISVMLRDSLYLYFSFYIFTFLLCRMGVEGYLHQYIAVSGGAFLDRSVSFFGGIAMIFFIKFFSQFILKEREIPLLRVGANIFLSISIFATAMIYVLNEYYFVGIIIGAIAFITAITSIIVSCYCWFLGIKAAKYFFLGNVLFIVAVAFIVLLDNGLIKMNESVAYLQYLGMIAQILLLSYALSQKIMEERYKRQEAQQASLEYLRQYETIYNNVADGLFRLNYDREIENANPALFECFGCESFQDFKDNFGDIFNTLFVYAKDYEEYKRKLDTLELNGNPVKFEVYHNKKGGAAGWGLCTIKLVYDENTKEKRYEGSFNDISDKKEKEVAEVAWAKAEAIAQAKGRFLATMSHEIRTPMNAIIGFTDIALNRGDMTDKIKEYFQRIRHSSDVLLGIINDILDFSKIEAGMLELERANFLLKDLLKKVYDMFIEEAQEKKLDFSIDVDPAIPAILIGDQLRLSQILINLVSNALKFTEQGKVNVKLTAIERRDEAMLVKFEVSDTGIGIENPNEQYLFEAFTQADESTTREFGGSGLGLSICKKLVDLHGGSIGCESELGKGSIFWFEIDVESPELFAEQTEPFPVFDDSLPRLDGKRILVAEDDKMSQVIAMEILADLGAETILCDDGLEVLEYLEEENVDLIVMDLHMPRMTGFEAVKKIREQGSSIPIVILTADTVDDVISDMEPYEINGSITKPIDIEKFASMLSELLSN